MFWKTKKVVKVDGLPITLSKRQAFNRFTGAITSHFLAYKNGDEWIGLVSYEQFREEMDEIRKRQELILDHLKLKYVPETKKPAKLVEKITVGCPMYVSDTPPTKPKKKRGRPKKK
jgi:hypothetical protein